MWPLTSLLALVWLIPGSGWHPEQAFGQLIMDLLSLSDRSVLRIVWLFCSLSTAINAIYTTWSQSNKQRVQVKQTIQQLPCASVLETCIWQAFTRTLRTTTCESWHGAGIKKLQARWQSECIDNNEWELNQMVSFWNVTSKWPSIPIRLNHRSQDFK